MKTVQFANKIKNYAVASFLVTLIGINACLLIYKSLGDFIYESSGKTRLDIYPNFNWDANEHTYSFNEFQKINNNKKDVSFINCPKFQYWFYYNTVDNEVVKIKQLGSLSDENVKLMEKLVSNNKIKSVTIKNDQTINGRCIKNNGFSYSLLKNFNLLETIIITAIQKNTAGFVKIENPYFYGEVSISRTARNFPSVIIFKTFIILSAFLLVLYWKNNLNLFNELKNLNILNKFSKSFFYIGILSCIFLALHATFLGLDFDSKIFSKMRRVIIILFIFFELCAQIFLTINLFKFREQLKEFIRPLVLKIKIIFVIAVFFATCLALSILIVGSPSTAFKHTLEWNYFSFLLLYYLLSRLLWK